jgi:hypothetical protein
MAEWMRARQPLEKRLERARSNAAEAAGSTVLASIKPGVLRKAWPQLTVDQQRAIVGAVVERVVIAPAESYARFDPGRISVDWRV